MDYEKIESLNEPPKNEINAGSGSDNSAAAQSAESEKIRSKKPEKTKKTKRIKPGTSEIPAKFSFRSYIPDRFREAVGSIKDFSHDPVGSLAMLLPTAGIISAVISLIVLVILFAANGGYNEAFGFFADKDFDHIFTGGNAGLMYEGPPAIIEVVLFALFAAAITVDFYMNTGVVRRILMTVVLVLEAVNCVVGIIFLDYFYKVAYEEIEVSAEELNRLTELYETFKGYPEILFLIIGLAISLFFLILVITKKRSRRIFLRAAAAAALVFLILPFLLLLIENVIGIIAVAIICVIVFLICLLLNAILDQSTPDIILKLGETVKCTKNGNLVAQGTDGKRRHIGTMKDFNSGVIGIKDSSYRNLTIDDIDHD